MLYAVSAPRTCISCPRSPRFSQKPIVSTGLCVRASLPDDNGGFKVEYTPWLIVGLGNPGNKYHGTRHNVGFEMIDRIAQAQRVLMDTIQSKALIGIGSIGEVPILLVKPQAYMNFSGESVGPLAAHYQVPLRHILVIYDEMSLMNGVLRLQPKGGHGHHNGVKSVMGHLDGCRDFPRLCVGWFMGCHHLYMIIVHSHLKELSPFSPYSMAKLQTSHVAGIGNPPGSMDMKAYLLQKFGPIEREQIDAALEQGVEAVRTLVLNGFDHNITRFNMGQKYKFHKV